MQPRLEPITRPDQTYWIRNLTRWILGEATEPEILVVDWVFSSLVRPRVVCVQRGRCRHYVGFSELASSPQRLAALLEKWEAVRIPSKEETA